MLFIIEAKSDTTESLAKHKLVYPVLALRPVIRKNIRIAPVYMRVKRTDQEVHYHILECDWPDPRRNEPLGIDQLTPKQASHLVLSGF